MLLLSTNEQKSKDGGCKAFYTKTGSAKVHLHELGTHTCRPTVYLGCYVQSARVAVGTTICIWCMSVADPGFSKWGGTVLSQMGGRTSCFQVKSA